MSRSELTGLDRDNDIDAVNNVIHIRSGTVDIKDVKTNKYKVLTAGLKNQYRERDVPVKRFVIDLILAKPKEISFGGNKKKKIHPKTVTTKYVVSSPTGQVYSPHNWYRRVYQPFMQEMHADHPDIPILNPHELRHTRATLWKDEGIDLYTIAKLLGHVDLDMLSKRYAHNSIAALKKALKYDQPKKKFYLTPRQKRSKNKSVVKFVVKNKNNNDDKNTDITSNN
jgi:integrase